MHAMPPLARGMALDCVRCGASLGRGGCDPREAPLALALAGLCLFALAAFAPMLGIRVLGRTRSFDLPAAPAALQGQGALELALVVAATTLVLPALRMLGLVSVLWALRRGAATPSWVPVVFGLVNRLRPWAMLEVFLLGLFVAYTRLQAVAEVDVGNAAYALGGLMLVAVALDAMLDADAVWRLLPLQRPTGLGGTANAQAAACDTCGLVQAAGPRHCARCHARLHRRRPYALQRAAALAIAALLLYLPANIYPFMTITYVAKTTPYTVLGGVGELLQAGMWPLALLVFVASIMIPLLKLAALAWLMVSTRRGSARRLRLRTRTYRVIAFVGRWSMIDVFMLSILVALLRLGLLSSVEPGIGAAAFAGVVVLTMLATDLFDPRLMWDAAGKNPDHT